MRLPGALLLCCAVAGWAIAPAARGESTVLALGYNHTCVRTALGVVQCAGSNGSGQIGDGTQVPRPLPTTVANLGTGVVAVAAGNFHSCALNKAGAIKCWGRNTDGQLGNGIPGNALTPTAVSNISGALAVSGGFSHTCALMGNGGVKCWGRNNVGQLGNGGGPDSPLPVDVTGLTGVVGISAGDNHTCAVTGTGAVKCWGLNTSGQLGDGSMSNSPIPVGVSGLASGVAAIAAGEVQSCALTTGGGVKCWGNGSGGRLGNGGTANSPVPVNVTGLTSGVSVIAVGGAHGCALVAGAAKCWGSNFYRQVGDGTDTDATTPVAVIKLSSAIAAIGAGGNHTCAVYTTGAVSCWGSNSAGQQANGGTDDVFAPVDVTQLSSNVAAVTTGNYLSCALTSSGGVKCWGDNREGGLGDGTFTASFAPRQVVGLTSGISAIATGYAHTCALTATGGVKCWGLGASGQLGNNAFANSPTPVNVSGLASGVSAIAAGSNHTCARTTGGGLKCWGLNTNGQLGNNSLANSPVPVDVTGLTSGVAGVAGGSAHTCAVTTGGAAKCWGDGPDGELGDGLKADSKVPVDVVGLGSGVAKVSAGGVHSCAITTGGALKCWGDNFYGQVGDGTQTDAPTPVDVVGLGSGVVAMAGGFGHSCAFVTGGAARCWGVNGNGQLGTGNQVSSNTPVPVPALPSGVTSIATGFVHSCVARNGGGQCWGFNFYGQVGVPLSQFSQFSFFDTSGSGYVPAPPLTAPPSAASQAGSAVAVAPGVVVAGAPLAPVTGQTSGEVYVYTGGNLASRTAATASDVVQGKALSDINLATLSLPTPLDGDKLGLGGVAINRAGTLVVAGAPGTNNGTGSVHVFKQPQGGWVGKVEPSQNLVPVGAQPGDAFGSALSMTNAGTVVVGAPGAVASNLAGAGKAYVLRMNGDQLQFAQTLSSSEPQASAHFGASVAGDGAELAIGAPGQTVNGLAGAGAVVTFREPSQGQNYALRDIILSLNPALADKFGAAVGLDDGTLVVGAPGHDEQAAPDAGAAMVFDEAQDGGFDQVAMLTDPTPDEGAALGTSVAVEEQTIAAGAPMDDVNDSEDQGSVAVFVPTTTDGSISGDIVPTVALFNPDGGAGDQYGAAVALSPDLAAAGAPYGDALVTAKRLQGKALAVEPSGEALAYLPNRVFKDSLESPRGALDGCASPDAAIPDNNNTGIQSEITLVGTGQVRDVDVSVRIAHTFVSDLNITLVHVPSGIGVPLYVPTLPAQSCASDDIDVVFSDQAIDGFAVATCNPFDPALDGARIPKDWLIKFQNLPRAGPWRLTVKDTSATNTGTLLSWCVDVR